ncbi:cadherin-like domain-containing protein, partial [Patiriisocius marinistellae]|uniref:cadherin-like domain-containing protein n=1 Tax=Patiriisocius marinistellae TaxID=2494560 RepID=UPI00125D9C84
PGTAQTIAVDNGTVTIDAAGVITFTPDANFNGDVVIPYVITDGTATATANENITVDPINDAPVAVDDDYTVDEDDSVVLTPLDLDTDLDGDTLTIESINGTALTPGTAQTIAVDNGTVAIDAAGVITFTPDANFNGDVVIPYVITDGTATAIANENITVTSINDGPVAVDDTATTDEDIPVLIDVTANDTDLDGEIDPTTVTIVTAPTNGTVTVDPVTGEVTYTPDPDFTGTDTFEYQVCDDGTPVICDIATVTVTVDPVNDGPIAVDDTATVDEDDTVIIDVTANDTDIDGMIDPTTVTIVTPPTNGTVTVDPVTGEVTYTPDPDFTGTDTFQYEVCDDGAPVVCDIATVTVTVDPVNDAPIAMDDVSTTDPGVDVVIPVLTNDSDIDSPINPDNVTIITNPANGTVVVNADGTITYTPNPDFVNGTDTFEYQICDDGIPVLCDIATVTVIVPKTFLPPTANPDTNSTLEDTPLVVDAASGLLSNDTDPNPDEILTVTGFEVGGMTYAPGTTVSLTEGDLTINADGSYTFVPAENYNGPVPEVAYTISDGNGGEDTSTLNIDVTPVNDGPEAVDDVVTTTEDTPVAIDVTANDTDIDGMIDPTTVTIVTAPTNGTVTVDPVTGEVTYTPDPDFTGSDTFEYQVCDDGTPVICDIATVTVTVDPVNDGPIAVDDAATTDEDTPVLIDVTANDTDLDGEIDPTTVTIVTAPTNGTVTVDPVTGEVTYTPDPDFNGTDTFEYQVCDDGTPVICDIATVTVTVDPVNDGPLAVDDTATTDEDTPVLIDVTANDTDLDGEIDPATVTIVTAPANGTVMIDPVTGEVTYTPDPDFTGTDTFEYQVCDDGTPVICDIATVTVTVDPVNDGPVAVDDTATTDEDIPVLIDVTANDTDLDGEIDPTTVTIVTAPTNGTVTVDPVTGEVTYTPDPDFTGTDTFEYQVCDDGTPVICDTATVTVTVDPVNDGPVAVDDTATTDEDTPVLIDVTANDTDLDGEIDPTTVTIVTAPTNGTVMVDPVTGEVTYTPDPDFNGTDTFEYQVCDDGTPVICDIALVTITVDPVAEDLTAVADDYSATPVNGTVGGTVPGVNVYSNDTLNGNPLNPSDVILTSTPTAELTVNTDGTVDVTPGTPAGTYMIDYTICENLDPTNCDTTTVTVVVEEDILILGVTSDSQLEGADLQHTVTLSSVTTMIEMYPFSITDNTTEGGDDYIVIPMFTNGVTFDPITGMITVPVGVTSFTVITETLTDMLAEGNEYYDLMVGGESATGTIIDADSTVVISVTDAIVTEGEDLIHTVTLSVASATPIMFSFEINDDTTMGASDYSSMYMFSDGVTYDPVTGTITVPAGVTEFTVTVASVDDFVIEETETYDIIIDSVFAIGTILDNDDCTSDPNGDCDGDGTPNGDDTNPLDPCLGDIATGDEDVTNPIYANADCDMDGLTNGEEITGIDDPNTPANPNGNITDPNDADSDGDGVTDGQEALNGTDPNDFCDYDAMSVALPQSQAFLDADCDGDGITNGQEIIDGTDPQDPCSGDAANATLPQSGDYLDA